MGVRLPAEYQEVEFIEGDGTQYIDTNIPLSTVTGFFLDVIPKSEFRNTGYGNLIGASLYQSGWKDRFWLSTYNGGNITDGLSNSIYQVGLQKNVRSRVELKNGVYVSDLNPQRQIEITILVNNGTNVYLFYDGRDDVSIAKMVLYSARIYNGDSIVRDFVPCYRKSDDKPGMYDLVSSTFYTNDGTGVFLKGADVIDSISPWMVARRRSLMMPRKYGPNLLALSDFTRASEGATWVVDDQTGIITVTGNSVYSGASTQSTFAQSHLIAGHTYEMHCKLISATNLNGARFSIRGVRGNEHQTAYTVRPTAVGEESSVVFTADEYMKYFTLFSKWTDAGSQTIAYSDVWVKEILS